MTSFRIFDHAAHLGFQDFRVFWTSWRMWLGTHVVRVFTTAAMWILLGRLVESEEHVRFLLIGQVVILGAQYTGWTVAAFTWDRMFIGTYPMLVASPSSLVPVMLGRTSIWLLNGIATSWVTFLILVPVFRLPVSVTQILWVPLAISLVCASSYGLAFSIGSIINWVPRLRNIAHNTASIVMMTICGVVVPVAFWPEWVQTVAFALPVTHGLSSIRLLMADEFTDEVLVGVVLEAAVGLVWLGLGALILDRTVNAARRTGAIDLI